MINLKILITVIFTLLISGCAISYSGENMFDSPIQKEEVLKLAGNYEKLINDYKKKLKIDDNSEDRLKLSQLYYEIKDYDSAKYFIQPLVDKFVNENILLLYTKILEEQGEYQSALEAVNELLSLNPRKAEAWNLKGIIFASNGYKDEAKKSFLIAKDLFFDDCIVNSNLGALEILQNNYQKAIEYFEPLYARNCNNTQLIHNYAFALIKTKQYKAAETLMQTHGISKNPYKLISQLLKARPNDFKDE